MRAIRVHNGGELRLEEIPDPTADDGEVVVALRAIGVNRRDLLVREPPGDAYRFPMPFTPGLDGAGVRCDTQEEVVIYPCVNWGESERAGGPDWQLLGGRIDGTYADYIRVPAANCFPKPTRFTWEQAAALPVAGLTAYRALFTVGDLRPGQTVLVLGAGSGVSTIAIMLAAQAEAHILVTSSREEKITRARSIGAQEGVLYTDEAWPDDLLELTGGRGVDLVFDSVGSTWNESLRCLKRGGTLVALGGTGGGTVDLDVRHLYLNWLSIFGTTLGSPRDFSDFLDMAADGSWDPVIDSVRPLAAAEDAHERLRSGEHFGKLILAP